MNCLNGWQRTGIEIKRIADRDAGSRGFSRKEIPTASEVNHPI
jgi:hypothetical protein